MNFLLPVLAAVLVSGLAGCLWWLMARQPDQWSTLVDRENDFWRDKGVISRGFADRLKRLEKSAFLKWLAAITTIIAAVGLLITLAVLIRVELIEHHRLRMPYNPALHRAPARPVIKPAPKPKPLPKY